MGVLVAQYIRQSEIDNMGRGQGPQGGAGKQGGALSSKSSKPRKPRSVGSTSFKKATADNLPAEESELVAPAYIVVPPQPQQRAELMRTRRNGEVVQEQMAAKAAAAARVLVNGTAPTGSVLGGDSVLDPEDVRQARLQHLAKQQKERRAEQVATERGTKDTRCVAKQQEQSHVFSISSEQEHQAASRAVAELPIVRRRRDGHTGIGAADGTDGEGEFGTHVAVLLDMLAERLRHEEDECSIKLLCTVLGNGTKDDPKYRRLRASNDKLWLAILQHPELCALIEAAGFEQHSTEGLDGLDRCAEMEQIQVQLQDQLEGVEPPAQTTVESLLSHLEELQAARPSPELATVRSRLPGEAVERDVTFVHAGGEALLDLAAVLEATLGWAQRSRERLVELAVD